MTVDQADLPMGFARTLWLHEVFHQLGQQLKTRPVAWRTLPGLMTEAETFDRRMADVAAHRRAKVNFVTIVKRFVRKRYPLWEFAEAGGDMIVFENLPVARLNLRLLIQRHHHWGLGKAFSLGLGIKLDSDDVGPAVELDLNLFKLFGCGDVPSWCYVTSEELEQSLAGVAQLLDQMLVEFENIAMAMLHPLPTRAPDVEIRGNLTAREAWDVAQPLAFSRDPEAQLALITGHVPALHNIPNELQPGTVDWRLCWNFLLLTPGNLHGIHVVVPNVGRAAVEEFTPPRTLTQFRVGSEWIDNNAALNAAAKDRRNDPGFQWSVQFELTCDPPRYGFSQPIWRLCLFGRDPDGRYINQILVYDAVNGNLLSNL